MEKRVSVAEVIVAIAAFAAAVSLYLYHQSQPRSEPQAGAQSLVRASSAADMAALREAATRGYYEDFIGHFGEQRYERVRQIYLRVFQLAAGRWYEYHSKAEAAASREYERLQERVASLGREALNELSLEERLQLTQDRQRYNDFVFQAGIKRLSSDERRRIENVEDFRLRRDRDAFIEREAWTYLASEDRAALGSSAALSRANTPEKLSFLSKVGVPLLPEELRKEIAGIDWSELTDPRTFMLRHGEPLAQEFLSQSTLSPAATVTKCTFPKEDEQGSLLRGPVARCEVILTLPTAAKTVTIVLLKQGFEWKADQVEPDFFAVPEMYSGRRREAPKPAEAEARPAAQPQEELPPRSQRWEHRPPSQPAPPGLFLEKWARAALVGTVIWIFAAALFVLVMCWNYLRLRHETISSDLMDGEQPIAALTMWRWGRKVESRLTTHRVHQLRLSWLLSKRRYCAVSWRDIHSVVWRRYTNWLLLVASLFFVGRLNPLALFLLLLGLEGKIYSIRFNTVFAQIPWIGMAVMCFTRKQFQEMLLFYRKAHSLWTQQTRPAEEPVSLPRASPTPAVADDDFRWGIPVWAYAGIFVALAFVQRVSAPPISFDDYVFAPLYLGLVFAAALRSRRDAVWAAILGPVALLTVKFPSTVPLLGLPLGFDGGMPLFEQYFALLLALVVLALVASVLAQISPIVAVLAFLAWIGFVALQGPALALDFGFYSRTALAAGVGAVLAWIDRAAWSRLGLNSTHSVSA